MSDSTAAPPIELSYGRYSRRRACWRWILATVLFIAIAGSIFLGYPQWKLWLDRRAGQKAVEAWYQQARTYVVPAGALLYSEDAGDVAAAQAAHSSNLNSWSWPGGPAHWSVQNSGRFPLLRQVTYANGSIPILSPIPTILYVHEHPLWSVPNGSRPYVFSIGRPYVQADGHLTFPSMAVRLPDASDTATFPGMGSGATVKDLSKRSLNNLRIFAGSPDAKDPTRFRLPFTCDGGAGRFEFQTDVDVSDGGFLAPNVWIEWDDATTTQSAIPTTRTP